MIDILTEGERSVRQSGTMYFILYQPIFVKLTFLFYLWLFYYRLGAIFYPCVLI